MKEFISLSSYIDESQVGRHKTFMVENDMDRDKDAEHPFIDLYPEVRIDGVVRRTIEMRPSKKSYHRDMINYKKGDIIGIEVSE